MCTVESCSEYSAVTDKDIGRRGSMFITSVARHLFAYLKIGHNSEFYYDIYLSICKCALNLHLSFASHLQANIVIFDMCLDKK